MDSDRWNHRFNTIDGTFRSGTLELGGQRFELPIILDPLDRKGSLDVISMDPRWENVKLKLSRSNRPLEIPRVLREAMQEGLLGIKASSLFPVVSTTDRELLGTVGDTTSPLTVHVIRHFDLVSMDPVKAVQAMVDHHIDDPLHAPVYLQGISDHGNVELLSYLGMEIFDTRNFRIDGARGLYHTDVGVIDFKEIDRYGGVGTFCNCDHCRQLIEEPSGPDETFHIIGHNIEMLRRRLFKAVAAQKMGKLRELVMASLSGNPSWMSGIRSVERSPSDELLNLYSTFRKVPRILVSYRDDLNDPDFINWRRRVMEEYVPISGRKVLLLLPCSARKPYSTSRTHQRIKDALKNVKGWKDRVQQVVVTSPLGAVPLELEDLYPASFYDIPVTGEWFPEELEASREVVGAIFSKGNYDSVICFHKQGNEFFPPESADRIFRGADLIDIHTISEEEGSDPYWKLASTLSEVLGPGRGGNYEKEELLAQVKFSLGYDLSEIPSLEVKWSSRGRELRKDRRPVMVFKKGGPVPTTEGGKLMWDLKEKGEKRVIIDDFRPKGTIFSMGIISVYGKVRPGDIVIVGTDKEFRGVGRALVSGEIMTREIHGPAVQMVHSVKG